MTTEVCQTFDGIGRSRAIGTRRRGPFSPISLASRVCPFLPGRLLFATTGRTTFWGSSIRRHVRANVDEATMSRALADEWDIRLALLPACLSIPPRGYCIQTMTMPSSLMRCPPCQTVCIKCMGVPWSPSALMTGQAQCIQCSLCDAPGRAGNAIFRKARISCPSPRLVTVADMPPLRINTEQPRQSSVSVSAPQ